jgi:hypothetical protein
MQDPKLRMEGPCVPALVRAALAQLDADFDADGRRAPPPPLPRACVGAVLTEIHLCLACSCQEILRTETARQLAAGAAHNPRGRAGVLPMWCGSQSHTRHAPRHIGQERAHNLSRNVGQSQSFAILHTITYVTRRSCADRALRSTRLH